MALLCLAAYPETAPESAAEMLLSILAKGEEEQLVMLEPEVELPLLRLVMKGQPVAFVLSALLS